MYSVLTIPLPIPPPIWISSFVLLFTTVRAKATLRSAMNLQRKHRSDSRTAITTRADWKVLDDTHLLLATDSEQMIVAIDASGKVAFTSETIEVNSPAYTRIGIALKNQSKEGYIRLKMYTK